MNKNMSLSKLWEIVKNREAWRAAVHGLQRVRLDLPWAILPFDPVEIVE